MNYCMHLSIPQPSYTHSTGVDSTASTIPTVHTASTIPTVLGLTALPVLLQTACMCVTQSISFISDKLYVPDQFAVCAKRANRVYPSHSAGGFQHHHTPNRTTRMPVPGPPYCVTRGSLPQDQNSKLLWNPRILHTGLRWYRGPEQLPRNIRTSQPAHKCTRPSIPQ